MSILRKECCVSVFKIVSITIEMLMTAGVICISPCKPRATILKMSGYHIECVYNQGKPAINTIKSGCTVCEVCVVETEMALYKPELG